MAKLELFLLGPPRLERDGVPLQFDTRKIMALVAYLAVSMGAEGAHLSRDSLLALLWPDLEPSSRPGGVATQPLAVEERLGGRVVGGGRPDGRHRSGSRLLAGCGPVQPAWCAPGKPTTIRQEQVCPECLEALTKAVALYQGEFLEGFGLRDSIAYDEWQFFQAEGLRQELASALNRLVDGYSAQGNQEAALDYARRWLALDPLHEPAHRQLMQLYAQAGQRSAALRQYQECVRILDEELGLAPAKETAALYEQIRTRSFVDGQSAPNDRPAGETGLRAEGAAPSQPASPDHALCRARRRAGRDWSSTAGSSLPAAYAAGSRRDWQDAVGLAPRPGPAGSEPTPFEHGVFFVPLAPLQQPRGWSPLWPRRWAIPFTPATEGSARTTPRQQLLDYLKRKQLLLVMDNYEHLLVDEAPQSGEAGAMAQIL